MKVSTSSTPPNFGGEPLQLHSYQKDAVAFLQNRRRAGLFLDMGLG